MIARVLNAIAAVNPVVYMATAALVALAVLAVAVFVR